LNPDEISFFKDLWFRTRKVNYLLYFRNFEEYILNKVTSVGIVKAFVNNKVNKISIDTCPPYTKVVEKEFNIPLLLHERNIEWEHYEILGILAKRLEKEFEKPKFVKIKWRDYLMETLRKRLSIELRLLLELMHRLYTGSKVDTSSRNFLLMFNPYNFIFEYTPIERVLLGYVISYTIEYLYNHGYIIYYIPYVLDSEFLSGLLYSKLIKIVYPIIEDFKIKLIEYKGQGYVHHMTLATLLEITLKNRGLRTLQERFQKHE